MFDGEAIKIRRRLVLDVIKVVALKRACELLELCEDVCLWAVTVHGGRKDLHRFLGAVRALCD